MNQQQVQDGVNQAQNGHHGQGEGRRHSKGYSRVLNCQNNAILFTATAFEAEIIEFETTGHKFEKEVDTVQRDIAKVEDQLDIAISTTKVS